jgi:hypothetical protein
MDLCSFHRSGSLHSNSAASYLLFRADFTIKFTFQHNQSGLRPMLPDSNLDRGRGAQKHHEGKEECYPRHLESSFTSVLPPSKLKGLQGCGPKHV